MTSTLAGGETTGEPVPASAEDPAVVRRQGPEERCQAAELLVEPVEDADAEDAEDDFESDEDVLDELDDFEAALLLDVEPRESLR
jgi:hypothetical protein